MGPPVELEGKRWGGSISYSDSSGLRESLKREWKRKERRRRRKGGPGRDGKGTERAEKMPVKPFKEEARGGGRNKNYSNRE